MSHYQSQIVCLLLVAICVVVFSGCRGRHPLWNSCNLANGGCTIAPPATGSYNVNSSNDPYYGTTFPPISGSNPPSTIRTQPAAGNGSAVPAQPASSTSPGWRPAGSNDNQTYNQPPNSAAGSNGNRVAFNPSAIPNRGIPMNNVVSSTQVSRLNAPDSNLATGSAERVRTASNDGLGMPVNDATQLNQPAPFTPGNTWNNAPPANVINVQGTTLYQGRARPVSPTYQPTRSQPQLSVGQSTTSGTPAAGSGWQQRGGSF